MNRIVVPISAADEGGMDALDSLLDSMDNGTEPEQPAQQTDNQSEPEQEDPAGGNDNQTQTRSAQDKQNFAFGQMRTQINQLTDLLGRVAKANGVEYSDNKDLISKLSDDAISKMAQRQNVPVELLREVEALRMDSQAFKAQQLRDAAAIGFQNVMDTYSLTQDQLKAFAVELDEKGLNPFEQQVDIMTQYKMLHFDDIMNSSIEKAVQAALAKSGAADQHSSTPAATQGSNGDSGEKISTVAGLSALLDGMQ